MASDYVDPSTIENPTTGQAPSASWGDTLNDDLNWLARDRPAARVYNDANLTHSTNGGWQAVSFNSERYDTTAMHSTTTNQTRLTIGVTGLYLVGGCVDFAADVDGRRDLQIWISGSQTNAIVADSKNNLANSVVRLNVSTAYRLTSGSYIELMAYQDSGGNLTINNTGKYSPEFWAHWIGV